MNEKRARALRWLVKAAVSIGLMLLLLWQTDLERLSRTIAHMDIGWLLIAVVIKGTGILAGVLRWRLLLAGQDIFMPVSNLAGAYLIGRFFGSFLPSTIGLDAYRTYYIAVRTGRVARSVAVTLVEKVIGLFALSLLMLVALPFGLRLLPAYGLWLLGCVACFPVIAAGLLLFYPGLFLRISEILQRRGKRVGQGIAKVSNAIAGFEAFRARLVLATLLGFVVHGATSAMYIATARAVGAEVSASEILFVGPLMIAATLVPLSIAGIGVREGTYVFFLSRIGVIPEQATLLAFLGFLVGELFSLAGGGVWAFQPAARPDQGHRLTEVIKRTATWARVGFKRSAEEVRE